jgi:hypothetical protein
MEEIETNIALANHPDSQPRRILSYAVTGRWLRPQIEPLQSTDQLSGTHEPPAIGFPAPDRSRGKTNTTPLRKNRKSKKKKNPHGQRVPQPPEIPTAGDTLVHASDPNEPRYCYCDNVSYGAVRVFYPSSAFLKLITYRRWCNVKTAQDVHTIG